jgi:hypothetical protein
MDKEIQKILDNYEKRISALETLEKIIQTSPSPTIKKLSIREFILSKSPKGDVNKTLAIGYFFEKYEKMSSFNANDLERGFHAAREKVPLNINDKINLNIKKGMMMEADEKKDNLMAWMLTNKGENFVESDFKEVKK